MISKFWQWYEKNYLLNISVATGLFVIQLIHLLWLALDVIAYKVLGFSIISLDGLFKYIIVLVDYTEIPALISVSFVYVNDLRKGFTFKPILYLLFLNIQWLHLFWITDEFVIEIFRGTHNAVTPAWLAWIAILIDYLEVPVIIETIKKFIRAIKEKQPIKKEYFG